MNGTACKIVTTPEEDKKNIGRFGDKNIAFLRKAKNNLISMLELYMNDNIRGENAFYINSILEEHNSQLYS